MLVNRGGQALILIVIILAVAVLTLSILFRVFAMTPAYIYQRSIYYVFKYNPTLVAQGLVMDMNTALMAFARNFSWYMVNRGINLYLYSLVGVTPVHTSIIQLLRQEFNVIVGTVYVPTGLAVPVGGGSVQFSYVTNYYGALGTGLRYIYSGGGYALIFVNVTNIYNMPTLGVYNLTLSTYLNLTASLVKPGPSTCSGGLTLINYTVTYRCLFNFTTNTYTCMGPGFSISGVANNLWAPSYTQYSNNILSYTPNVGWVTSGNNVSELLLVYPIDELNGPSGFKISALFTVNSLSNLIMGVNFLAQYPTSGGSTGYTYLVTPSGVYFDGNLITSNVKVSANSLENLTIYVVPNTPYSVFDSSPTATVYLYLNGSQVYSSTINLPAWHYVYSSAFGNYAYMLSGQPNLGSWVIILFRGAALKASSFKLYATYQLPTSIYLMVSLNGGPVVGVNLGLSIVKPGLGVTSVPVGKLFNYTVCNVTNSGIVFNVNLPNPNALGGYPYYQYLINISYSGINLLVNPWAPSSLKYYGLQAVNLVPGGYSATSMGPYWLILYNSTSNTLTYLFPLWNGGSPTLLLDYLGIYVTAYINGIAYYYTGPVTVPSTINPLGTLTANYTMYTYSELLIHEPTGYVMIGEVSKLPPSAPNPVTYTNYIWEFQRFPNQTLPYTYFTYTVMDCTGVGHYSGLSYSNYALIFVTPSNPQYGILMLYYETGNGDQSC